MVEIVLQTFKCDRVATDTYRCYNMKGVVSVLTYARWQAEQSGNHSNVDLTYNGVTYYGAI